MTLLPDHEIKRRVAEGALVIDPFEDVNLGPAGYDARLGEAVKLSPGRRCLAYTLERFELPLDLAGLIHLRSSLAREGLMASLALVDPGFRGHLTLPLFNAGDESIEVEAGERIVQVSFYRLEAPASRGYSGRYQDSVGAVPSRRKRG